MVCHPNRITIESKPCYVIQSKTVILTPRVNHYHFPKVYFLFLFHRRMAITSVSSTFLVILLQFRSTTGKCACVHARAHRHTHTHKHQASQYQYHSRLFWESECSPSSFIISPLGSGICMCQSLVMGNLPEAISPLRVQTGLGAFHTPLQKPCSFCFLSVSTFCHLCLETAGSA